jgi:hypothetical protein
MAVSGVLLLCVWAIRVGSRKLYYLDRDSVHSALAGIPSGKVIQVAGFDDGITWTVANAEVSVDGFATRTIMLRSPRWRELQNGRRMCVMGLGPYALDVEVGDERVLVQHLDFGRNSEFGELLPFRPRDVRELAARYDEIVAFITQEPSGVYTTREGKRCTYRIRARQ